MAFYRTWDLYGEIEPHELTNKILIEGFDAEILERHIACHRDLPIDPHARLLISNTSAFLRASTTFLSLSTDESVGPKVIVQRYENNRLKPGHTIWHLKSYVLDPIVAEPAHWVIDVKSATLRQAA